MKVSVTKRPSPAIIVAVVALAFAMVGTAVAGTDGLSAKLTKSKVKSIAKKQADKELKANVSRLARRTSPTTPTNATTAANATQLNGQSSSAYASSATAVRYVTVLANGTIVDAETKGVTQAPGDTHPNDGRCTASTGSARRRPR